MSDDLIYESYRQVIYQVMQQLAGEANNGQIAYLGGYDPRRGKHQVFFGCRRSNRKDGSEVGLQRPDYISAPVPFSFKPGLSVNRPPIPDSDFISSPNFNPLLPERKELDVLPKPKLEVPRIFSPKNPFAGRPGRGHSIRPGIPSSSPRIIRPKYPQIIIEDPVEDHWPIIEWEIVGVYPFTTFKVQIVKDIEDSETAVGLSARFVYEGICNHFNFFIEEDQEPSLGRAVYLGRDMRKTTGKPNGYIYVHFIVVKAVGNPTRIVTHPSLRGHFLFDEYDKFKQINDTYWRGVFASSDDENLMGCYALIYFGLRGEYGLTTHSLYNKRLYKYEPPLLSKSSLYTGDKGYYLCRRKNPSFKHTSIRKGFRIKLYRSLGEAKDDLPFKTISRATGFFISDSPFAFTFTSEDRVKQFLGYFKKPEKLLEERTFFGARAELPFKKEVAEDLESFVNEMEFTKRNGITDGALRTIQIVDWFDTLALDQASRILSSSIGSSINLSGNEGEECDIIIEATNEIRIERDSGTVNLDELPGFMDLVSEFVTTVKDSIPEGVELVDMRGRAKYLVRKPDDYITIIIPKSKYKELMKRWLGSTIPSLMNDYLTLAFGSSFLGYIHPKMGLVDLREHARLLEGTLIFESAFGEQRVDFSGELYARAVR